MGCVMRLQTWMEVPSQTRLILVGLDPPVKRSSVEMPRLAGFLSHFWREREELTDGASDRNQTEEWLDGWWVWRRLSGGPAANL